MLAKNLNLRATVESGQPLAFYCEYSKAKNKETIRYPTQRGVLSISKTGDKILHSFYGNYNEKDAEKEVAMRLGLGHDMKKIYGVIDCDPFMHSAIKNLYGLRLTHNPPWETTLVFLVSQFNNIKRIRGIMKTLITRYGNEIYVDGKKEHIFPSPQSLSDLSIDELIRCGTGYRAKYIKAVASSWQEIERKKLHKMKYAEAKDFIKEFPGIGDKVADCILLMGYAKLEAFPIDVWIKRVVENVYFNRRKKSIKEIHGFAVRKWGLYAGYAQQYLYWYGRNSM